jgi:hypothetical protein
LHRDFRILIFCCLAVIAALLVVGAVSHGIIRHLVQTSPLWITVALALRRSPWSKWSALPCLLFWVLLMTAIWLYLLGWARIVSGTFSPTEIAMTIIVGAAAITGIANALQMRTVIRFWPAASAYSQRSPTTSPPAVPARKHRMKIVDNLR